jgi:hypothetical protein
MDAMAFLPAASALPGGATLLLGGALFMGLLGLVAFSWAVWLIWRENNPPKTPLRLSAPYGSEEPASSSRHQEESPLRSRS